MTEELIIEQAFPSKISEEVKSIFEKHSIKTIYETPRFFKVSVKDEELKIPYRIYYDDKILANLNEFTQVQQNILNCLYSRHHDGFVRQKCISKIITSKHSWTIPFIIQVISEYVIEILDEVNDKITSLDEINFKNFLLSNKEFYKIAKDRVASYWNCYYRMQYPKKEDFVGFKILRHLDKIISGGS